MKHRCKYCGSEKVVLEKKSSNYYSVDGSESLHGSQSTLYVCLNCQAEEWDLDRLVGGGAKNELEQG